MDKGLELTQAFRNKHNTPRIQRIAEENTILRSVVGSGLYGTSIADSDRDEMGICIEPPECVIGLEHFDQWESPAKPEGVRSGPGDVDFTIYSLRKWASLAAKGNPSLLLLLYVPAHQIVALETPGWDLQHRADMFLSREAGKRFMGYLQAQKEQMLGLRAKHTNRPELIDIYGFDTKFAYHAIRLGIQGVELLSTGRITLPIPEPDRTWLKDLRLGYYTKEDALTRINELDAELKKLTYTADLPEKVDYGRLNRWLTETYQSWWNN